MDWLKEVLELYYPNSTHPPQHQPLNTLKIKPIISSRDILNISSISRRSRFSKSFPKSLRTLSIKQTEGRELTLQDLKRITNILKNNKYLHTFQLSDSNSTQLKILAEKLRKFHRLRAFTMDYFWSPRNYGAQALLSLPKCLQDLTYLKFGFHPEEWQGKKLNFGLKNLKHLTTLYLDVSDNEYMKVEDMEIITSNLKICRYLKNLTLNFEYCDYMRNKAVYNLTSALQMLHSLSKLDLRFKDCYLINHKAAQSLASNLNCLQNITSLTLDFDSCSKMNSTGITSIFKALRGFKNLKALDFSFPFSQDVNEGINFFFQELVHIQTLLQFLKFNIPAYSHVISEDLFKNISEALKVQSQLQSLVIKLKSLKIEGLWAKYLAEGFKNMKNLSDLVLNFKNNQSLDDKNAEFLGEGLKELGSLSTLQLNLKNHKFTPEGVEKILEGIGTMKHLKEMDLILEKENPKGFTFSFFNKHSDIKGLAPALNNLNNIKSLNLDLALRDARDQDFSQFSLQLSTMKQLTTLSLTFNKFKSPGTIEKGLQKILSNIRHLSNLTDLCLKVQYGSNKDLSEFFGSLKDLVNLESLEINFLELKGFDFDTAHQFIEAMERLEKLRKLNLNIDFENKSAKEVALFLSGILKLKSLSILQYYFGRVESAFPLVPFLENWRKIKTLRSLICFDGCDEIL